MGWDWFSIQMDDGGELMVFRLRKENGSDDPFSSGTYIAPDGNMRNLDRDEFENRVEETWHSPDTGAAYPARWTVIVPVVDLALEIEPYLADQELTVSYAYWEGAVRVVFAVNHLGHFLLVNLLLDCLLPPARILFVSSGAHDLAEAQGPMQPPRYIKAAWLAHPELDPDLPADDAFAGGQAYATSKLCNLLCAYELARRLEGSGLSTPEWPIAVHAFAPGLVADTGLGRDEKAWTRFTWRFVLPVMSRLLGFGRTPAQAGADLAYLATAPELAGVTGKYFRGRDLMNETINW